jgi:hypothetical protein
MLRILLISIISFSFLSITIGQDDKFAPPPPEEETSEMDIVDEVSLEPLLELVDHQKDISERIQPDDIKKHLETIASDEMQGRETGTPGQRKAAEYIAGHFKNIGLEPTPSGTYFQSIQFSFNRWRDISLSVNGQKYRFMYDYYAFSSSNETQEDSIMADEVVFVGYGIEHASYNDYEGVDVKGKVVMMYQGEPMNRDSISYITKRKEYSKWALNWKTKLETAKRKGVKAVIFIEPNITKRVSKYRDRLLTGHTTMGMEDGLAENFANSIYVAKDVAKAIIGKRNLKKFIKNRDKIRKTGRPNSLVLPAKIALAIKKDEEILNGENVLGFIEGRDSVLKNDIVVVSAHYDHLGQRGDDIYNGADDNGSGTSTVLDIAEAFAYVKKEMPDYAPRRSILFMLVSGEEKGLLGSQYYVNYPVYPLEKTIVDVNVDMIGRVDEKHAADSNYIYVIGADRLSTELHDINETMNDKYTGISLDYTYNEEDDPNRYYYRSDHYNFAEKGIPAIFYFSGVHADYHRTTDTVDKINFEKTAKIGQLIFHTVWQLANQDKTIEVNVKVK